MSLLFAACDDAKGKSQQLDAVFQDAAAQSDAGLTTADAGVDAAAMTPECGDPREREISCSEYLIRVTPLPFEPCRL